MPNLQQNAINCALTHDWKQAVDNNKALLEINSDDIDALKRLAYAYTKLGKIEKAKKIYRQILNIDKYNHIAQKNLEKIKSLPKSFKENSLVSIVSSQITPGQFIEEPGKTKIVILTNTAPFSVLSKLHIGDTVYFHPKKHTVEIRSSNNTYIGALPDDISFRLLKFIQAGNDYYVFIKNIHSKGVSIFIKEIKRGKKLINQPTFMTTHEYYASSTPRTLRDLHKTEGNEDETQDNQSNEEKSESDESAE
ncbi:tetratricopeptide repeat protein [Candidatus Gottesmanbacteria bacterium]|nr:tetratricopeptide repeat protein [Candidatus Gottesmanbacteria bacterium]